jgi:hypothetical protein
MPREKRVVEISRTVIFLNKFDHEHGEKYLDYNSRETKVKSYTKKLSQEDSPLT